jgi:hypothetical protein
MDDLGKVGSQEHQFWELEGAGSNPVRCASSERFIGLPICDQQQVVIGPRSDHSMVRIRAFRA